MPARSRFGLPREGITPDTLYNLINNTALNPTLTLPLLLSLYYTTRGASFATGSAPWLPSTLKVLAGVGVLTKFGSWLSDKMANNWTRDTYDWGKEVVVVTGGADGIGRKIVEILVERLGEKGVKIGVLDLQEWKGEVPPNVHSFKCDITSPSSLQTATTALRDTLGPPTILINNAGIVRPATILGTTPTDLLLAFKVNTFAHYSLAQLFLPNMIATNHGMIVTIASLAGYCPAPLMVPYCATKAAAVTFHEGLGAELVTEFKAPAVRTVLVCQGYTRTALFEGFNGSALYPETVAEETVNAVIRGRSTVVVLPRIASLYAPGLRGWPLWAQEAVRKSLGDVMKGWTGRNVVQPSENREEK